jgi:hypothetical protein
VSAGPQDRQAACDARRSSSFSQPSPRCSGNALLTLRVALLEDGLGQPPASLTCWQGPKRLLQPATWLLRASLPELLVLDQSVLDVFARKLHDVAHSTQSAYPCVGSAGQRTTV